jgi:hypothetical protein
MAEEVLTAKDLARELRPTSDDLNRVFSIERLRDGEFTRRIREKQFSFAMRVLAFILGGLSMIAALSFWRQFGGLPGATLDCTNILSSRADALLDWAKALINTLFGAALALALGCLYSPERRD